MTEGEYKSALINLAQDGQVQFTPDQIDSMTLDEVKQHIPEDVKDIVETKIAARLSLTKMVLMLPMVEHILLLTCAKTCFV